MAFNVFVAIILGVPIALLGSVILFGWAVTARYGPTVLGLRPVQRQRNRIPGGQEVGAGADQEDQEVDCSVDEVGGTRDSGRNGRENGDGRSSSIAAEVG